MQTQKRYMCSGGNMKKEPDNLVLFLEGILIFFGTWVAFVLCFLFGVFK